MPGQTEIDAYTIEWISMAGQFSFNGVIALGSTRSKIFLPVARSFRASVIYNRVTWCMC